MENIVHNKYLPADGDELAECTVDWGPELLGLRLNVILKRVVCIDCGVCIGDDTNFAHLRQNLRKHRSQKKHEWRKGALKEFLDDVIEDVEAWDESGDPTKAPADAVFSPFEGLTVHKCFACRDASCRMIFARERAAVLHMRKRHVPLGEEACANPDPCYAQQLKLRSPFWMVKFDTQEQEQVGAQVMLAAAAFATHGYDLVTADDDEEEE